MKKFSELIKESVSCITADINPGNALEKTGLMNHYTPIQNIVTNVRNLFASRLSFIAAVGEDGVSLKLHSSKFVDQQSINDILYTPLYRDANSSVASYVQSQGLNQIKTVAVGKYFVVYFYADDLAQVSQAELQESYPCSQQVEMNLEETEINTFSLISEEEEEMKNATLEKIVELIDSKDKVKAAKQLEILVSSEIELPREYYFAGIKFKDGDEAIALRWRYTKKLPTGKTTENVRSIMHIFGKGDKGIWVQDFAKDSIVKLPEEMEKLIRSILDILEAKETDDPATFSFTGEERKRDEKDKNDDNNEDKDNDAKDKNNINDEEDNEDDDSRGDDDNK